MVRNVRHRPEITPYGTRRADRRNRTEHQRRNRAATEKRGVPAPIGAGIRRRGHYAVVLRRRERRIYLSER